jgi:hypothetical protein
MNYLVRAIKNLRPTAEFSFENDDYSTINWIILEGEAPTVKEIADEIKKIKASDVVAENDKAAAKVALLDRLGITEAEAKLLLA